MRQVYSDLVFKANIDDDVKVLVIRGTGEHFGSGGDLPEQAEMLSAGDKDISLLHEFGIDDEDVKYPPKDSYRFLHGLTDHYSKASAGRSEEHTSELQSLMRISYAVFCLKKKKTITTNTRMTPKHTYHDL